MRTRLSSARAATLFLSQASGEHGDEKGDCDQSNGGRAAHGRLPGAVVLVLLGLGEVVATPEPEDS